MSWELILSAVAASAAATTTTPPVTSGSYLLWDNQDELQPNVRLLQEDDSNILI